MPGRPRPATERTSQREMSTGQPDSGGAGRPPRRALPAQYRRLPRVFAARPLSLAMGRPVPRLSERGRGAGVPRRVQGVVRALARRRPALARADLHPVLVLKQRVLRRSAHRRGRATHLQPHASPGAVHGAVPDPEVRAGPILQGASRPELGTLHAARPARLHLLHVPLNAGRGRRHALCRPRRRHARRQGQRGHLAVHHGREPEQGRALHQPRGAAHDGGPKVREQRVGAPVRLPNARRQGVLADAQEYSLKLL
mmetsp:Transcript_34555/g.115408  ORF Transcript_34555/g.115408 Transcript_34555/m.115408 type:complete len:255 (-) Transcript_34555:36-800(-)